MPNRIKGSDENESSLIKNGLWLVLANGLENIGLLLLNIAIVRRFGAEHHGQFVYYVSIIVLIRLVFDAGLGSSVVKLISQGRYAPAKITGRAAFIMALFHLPLVLLIYFYPQLFIPAGASDFRLFAYWLLAMLAQNLAVSAFNGMHAMKSSFWISLIFETGKIGVLIHLYFTRPAFGEFIRHFNLILLGAGTATAVLLIWKFRHDAATERPGAHEPGPGYGSLLKLSLVLWIPTAAIALFNQIMPIAIKHGLSTRDVSFYTTLSSWSLMASVVLIPVANAFFAWTAKHEDRVDGHELRSAYFRFTGVIALGTALLLLLCKDLVLKIYGPEFQPLGLVFGFFILAQLADYPRFFTLPLLSGGNQAKSAMWLESARVASVLLAAMAGLFISRTLMSVGLAILVAQTVFGFLRLLQIRNRILHSPFPAYILILIAGSLGMLVGTSSWNPLGKILIACVLFAAFSGGRLSDIKPLGLGLGFGLGRGGK